MASQIKNFYKVLEKYEDFKKRGLISDDSYNVYNQLNHIPKPIKLTKETHHDRISELPLPEGRSFLKTPNQCSDIKRL